MNTEKVFTAFDKDDNELLLYRKDRDTYIDLNSDNNDIFIKENIDLETLKYLSQTLRVLKYMPEKLIKKLYNYDRKKLIETASILLGLKVKVTDLKKTKTESGWYLYGIPMHNYHYNWNLTDAEYGAYIFVKK